MRIGYVLFQFPSLTESFVLNEIFELIKNGHVVHIFSIRQPIGQFVHQEANEIDLSTIVHYMPDPKKIVNKIKFSIKSVGSKDWNYQSESITVKILSIAAAKFFCPIAKNLSLDVLHAHFNGIPAQTAMIMSEKLSVPFTFTAHASDIFVKPSFSALKMRIDRSLAVMTPSYYNRDYLHKMTGANEAKINVIRACPIMDKFTFINRKPQFPTILTVGRLVEKKGIRNGILSVKELVKEYPNISYKIIGSGSLRQELENLVATLKLTKNVSFLGNINDNSQIEELNNATIFILPCLIAKDGDRDGIPVSLMEAMYIGIPTVSTKISGIPELVENGKDGLLVGQNKVQEIVEAIKYLLCNESLRIQIGIRAKQKIVDNFNIHKEINGMLNIWKGC